MATLRITLTDDELRQLTETAAGRATTPEALASRWVRERLVHERERYGSGGRPRAPGA